MDSDLVAIFGIPFALAVLVAYFIGRKLFSALSYKNLQRIGSPLNKVVGSVWRIILIVITAIISFFVAAFVFLAIALGSGGGSTYGTPIFRPKT